MEILDLSYRDLTTLAGVKFPAVLRWLDLYNNNLILKQINGSQHKIQYLAGDYIQIGCEIHTTQHWRDHYRKIGKQHGYTEEQIQEYREYIFDESEGE